MKMVTAIVKPFKLDDIREELAKIGVQGMTISDVMGCGRQQGKSDADVVNPEDVSFLPKTRIEIAIKDNEVEGVIKAIQDAAATGRIGDGKIFVSDLSHVVRIRTGETNGDAL